MINLKMDGIEFNFDRICRACKTESDRMYSIFEAVALYDQPTKLAEMLMACSSVQVEYDDGLPTLLCVNCIEHLNAAFSFKKQCEDTDTFLREYVRKNGIKLEGTTVPAASTNVINESILDFNVIYSSEVAPEAKEEIKPDISSETFIGTEDKVFACQLCDKKFINAKNLRLHQRKHRKPTDYKCKVCSQEFPRLIHLRRHMRLHEVQKVYVCKICNKTVVTAENLKRHLTVHLRTKPHLCPLCTRGFKRADHLANHAKTCKGFRTFVCGVCNKGFTRDESLQLHLGTHQSRPNLQVLDTLENYEEHYIEVDSDKVADIKCIATESDWSSVSNFEDAPEEIYEDVGTENEVEVDFERDTGMEIKFEEELVKNEIPIESAYEEKVEEIESPPEILDTNPHVQTDVSNDPDWLGEVVPKRKRGRPRKGEIRSSKTQKNVRKRAIDKTEKFPCGYCDKVLNTLVGYEIHTRKHTGNKLYSCRICAKTFVRASQLTRHYGSHSAESAHQCELCSESFAQEEELQMHLLDHTNGEGMQQCDQCDETFMTEARLSKHKAVKHKARPKLPSEKKFKCHVCGKGFTTDTYRDIHVRAHTGEKNSECKTCGKRFNTKARLAEHMKFHDECSKKFLCSECGQRFIRYDYLVIHMRRHRGEKPFKCKYCGKGFPRTTDLTVHERYHTGEKTHLCMVCGRGFGRAYNLTVHMRTHTGEKPYQCTYCDAAFAQGNDLKAHVRRHTGERYHCDLCSEAFLMGYLLTQHKRSVHGMDVTSHIRRLKPSERVHLPTSQHPPLAPSEVTELQLAHALQNVTVINIPTGVPDNEALTDTQTIPIVPHVSDAVA